MAAKIQPRRQGCHPDWHSPPTGVIVQALENVWQVPAPGYFLGV